MKIKINQLTCNPSKRKTLNTLIMHPKGRPTLISYHLNAGLLLIYVMRDWLKLFSVMRDFT